MINSGSSFCRNENKYLLPLSDMDPLIVFLSEHLPFDPHSKDGTRYNVNTLYFDNDEYSMISRSISHPLYKEKMRVRSYGGSSPSYFLEFKNKLGKDVYKNRISISEDELNGLVNSGKVPSFSGDYKRDRFLLMLEGEEKRRGILLPKCLIQYKRVAFLSSPDDEYVRITIDTDLLARTDDFSINKPGGHPIIDCHNAILEIKVERALPLYLVNVLNELKLSRTGFSKYGTAFISMESSSSLASDTPKRRTTASPQNPKIIPNYQNA